MAHLTHPPKSALCCTNKLEYAAAFSDPHLISDKNILEKVQRCAAQYVKGIYTYNASVMQMLIELQWESLESCREQFGVVTVDMERFAGLAL